MAGLATAQTSERSLTIYNIHTNETVTAVFKRGARFDQAGVEKLRHAMRDHRRNEAGPLDPALLDLIWEMHKELGSKEPVHLISGYRSRATNDALRRVGGGQASESRHILGKAADVHFPDVPVKKLRYSALVREGGGVGYYPTSALPFVHVDTDRVRSWPRLPRHELALLFPTGSTQHQPADGGLLTPEDVGTAQARYRDLAQQIAAFHAERGVKPAVAIAAARPGAVRPSPDRIAALPEPIRQPAPTLVEQQRAAAPPRMGTRLALSAEDRTSLADLAAQASLMPQLVAGPMLVRRPPRPAAPSIAGKADLLPPGVLTPVAKAPVPERRIAAVEPAALAGGGIADAGRFSWGAWAQAPIYDDEHPEELSYRPFPITPYLTDTASQPVMHELVAHDVARTVEIIDAPDTAPTLRFRPSAGAASLLWAQQFTGTALGIDKLRAAQAEGVAAGAPAGVKARAVKTTQR